MGRNHRGSALGPAGRLVRPAIPSVLCLALFISTPGLMPGLATAEPGADSIAMLIAAVAQADQRLEDLSAEVETEQESDNKSLVDVETARDNAVAAEHDLEVNQQAVTD